MTPWDLVKQTHPGKAAAVNRCNFACECAGMRLGLQAQSRQKTLRDGNKLLGENFQRRELWRLVTPERASCGLGLWMSQISAAGSRHFLPAPEKVCSEQTVYFQHSLEHSILPMRPRVTTVCPKTQRAKFSAKCPHLLTPMLKLPFRKREICFW